MQPMFPRVACSLILDCIVETDTTYEVTFTIENLGDSCVFYKDGWGDLFFEIFTIVLENEDSSKVYILKDWRNTDYIQMDISCIFLNFNNSVLLGKNQSFRQKIVYRKDNIILWKVEKGENPYQIKQNYESKFLSKLEGFYHVSLYLNFNCYDYCEDRAYKDFPVFNKRLIASGSFYFNLE
jgi:hypothetical protein